jgi:hypothetical protein
VAVCVSPRVFVSLCVSVSCVLSLLFLSYYYTIMH